MGQGFAASQKDDLGAVDLRPESSPYASPLITLHFADGPPLSVPTQLLDKTPKLSSCCGYDMTLRLTHIPGDAGHVLVHYIFTGMYECLKPRGSSCYEKDAAEFTTGVRVYAIAREYGLPGLESMARCEIEKLGNRLQVAQILDVLKDELPSLSVNDMWLQNFLKSLVRSFITTSLESLGSLLDSAGQTLSFPYALLRAVVELWQEKTNFPNSSLNDIDISHDYHNGSAAARIETGPATNPEPNLTTVSESEMSKKEKKKKKKKKRVLELSDGIGTGEQNYSKEGEDRNKEDEGNGIALPAYMTTNIMPTSEPAASNAGWLRQTSAANCHKELEPKPIPQPSFLFGGSVETFANFSPEELRWKHELHSRITGLNG
ncbi:hypothetical protein F5Y03DRAFT_402835 [Xylaria venustula]|nr:hypothetical protein F5Y03DRAFT_402835 [Xylaria venustula]